TIASFAVKHVKRRRQSQRRLFFHCGVGPIEQLPRSVQGVVFDPKNLPRLRYQARVCALQKRRRRQICGEPWIGLRQGIRCERLLSFLGNGEQTLLLLLSWRE